ERSRSPTITRSWCPATSGAAGSGRPVSFGSAVRSSWGRKRVSLRSVPSLRRGTARRSFAGRIVWSVATWESERAGDRIRDAERRRPRDQCMTKGLVIRKEPLDKILAGTKTWEIRGKSTTLRGRIALIESKSGHVVGTCEVVDVVGPLTLAKLQRNAKR